MVDFFVFNWHTSHIVFGTTEIQAATVVLLLAFGGWCLGTWAYNKLKKLGDFK